MRRASLVLLGVLAAGCVPSMSQRYKSQSQPAITQASSGRTALSLQALAVPSTTTTKSVFDLTERGQQAFITALGATKPFHDSLRVDLTPKPATSTAIDTTKFTRRIVLNLVHVPYEGDAFYAADRVAWADLSVEIDTASGVRFVGYDKVDTGYEVVDLAKLTRSTNWSLTGAAETGGGTELSSTDPDDGSTRKVTAANKASVTGTVGETISQETALQKRYVSLAVRIVNTGRKLVVVREGARGIDLTGAVVVDAQFEVEGTSRQTAIAFRVQSVADKFTITRVTVAAPARSCAVLTGASDALIRHVRDGQETIEESDDKIEYQRSAAKAEPFRMNLPVTDLYILQSGTKRVFIASPGGQRQELKFVSTDEAWAVKAWIEKALAPGGGGLGEFTTASGGWTLVDSAGSPYAADPDRLDVVPERVGGAVCDANATASQPETPSPSPSVNPPAAPSIGGAMPR